MNVVNNLARYGHLISRSAVALSALLCMDRLTAQNNQAIFEQSIRPILKKNCSVCPAGAIAFGGLSMGSFDMLLAGGKHGKAITPGDSKETLLLQYVRGQRSPRMPVGGTLDAKSIETHAQALDRMKEGAPSSKRCDPCLEWLLNKPSAFSKPPVSNADWVKNPIDKAGRDHNTRAMTMWFAGVGVKPGILVGATDGMAFKAVENIYRMRDVHATVLHLIGLNDIRLTYYGARRNQRLTDTGGKVIKGVVA